MRVLVLLTTLLALAGCADTYGPIPAGNYAEAYQLDSGDQLRVSVFGEAELTNTYLVDGGGRISMPLVGLVRARGLTTQELEYAIANDLQNGFLRNPSVSVQVQSHRPFYILGEVNQPGEYPYAAGMTAETAAALAGGFSPRAYKRSVTVTRRLGDDLVRGTQLLREPILPGDTVYVGERFF